MEEVYNYSCDHLSCNDFKMDLEIPMSLTKKHRKAAHIMFFLERMRSEYLFHVHR